MRDSCRVVLSSILLLAGPQPRPAWAAESGPTGRIEGKVFAGDGKAALAGARVVAYHLASERVFSSEVVGSNAKYSIDRLPHGYLDLVVETPDGVYAGNQVLHLPPSGKAAVSVTLRPGGVPPGEVTGQSHPASEGKILGVAAVLERPRGVEFWRSPKGIAILVGTGALALLALAGSSGSSDPPASTP